MKEGIELWSFVFYLFDYSCVEINYKNRKHKRIFRQKENDRQNGL